MLQLVQTNPRTWRSIIRAIPQFLRHSTHKIFNLPASLSSRLRLTHTLRLLLSKFFICPLKTAMLKRKTYLDQFQNMGGSHHQLDTKSNFHLELERSRILCKTNLEPLISRRESGHFVTSFHTWLLFHKNRVRESRMIS